MNNSASKDFGHQLCSRKQSQIASFQASWAFDRLLSRDLILALTEEQLLWTPGERLGPFWKQFRHLGRVQENYMAALDTGVVNFSPVGATGERYLNRDDNGAPRPTNPDKRALLDYLEDLDRHLIKRLASGVLPEKIDWFGEPVGPVEHLFRMLSHETLHHGQWIVYCQILGLPFPESWHVWGL
jgi:uncharacterized damage-inducible protein DinB